MARLLRKGFSLMEMMIVLLIVAIIAAASAPMVNKKMVHDAASSSSPWVWTSLTNNSIAFNLDGNDNASATIGAASVPNASLGSPLKTRLYIDSGSIPQISIGTSDNMMHVYSGKKSLVVSDNSTAPISNFSDSVVIGAGTSAANTRTVAIGSNITANKVDTVGVGSGAEAAGECSIALGSNSKTKMPYAISTGYNSEASGHSAIAIGWGANASAGNSIALGRSTITAGNAIAIGDSANATGINSVAIGYRTLSTDNQSMAIGHSAKAGAANSIAIGYGANASESDSVAIGSGAQTNAAYSIAIGSGATASGVNSVAIGNGAVASASNVIELGGPNTDVYIRGRLFVAKNTYLNVDKGDTWFRCNIKNNDGTGGEYGTFFKSDGNYLRMNYKSGFYPEMPSDRRLKNVGKAFAGGLEQVRKLQVYNFTFKDDSTKTPYVGVMAQDLQKIFPNAVFKGGDGFLRIRTDEILYSLVNAVKELDNKVSYLIDREKKINDLEKRIEALEKKVK